MEPPDAFAALISTGSDCRSGRGFCSVLCPSSYRGGSEAPAYTLRCLVCAPVMHVWLALHSEAAPLLTCEEQCSAVAVLLHGRGRLTA